MILDLSLVSCSRCFLACIAGQLHVLTKAHVHRYVDLFCAPGIESLLMWPSFAARAGQGHMAGVARAFQHEQWLDRAALAALHDPGLPPIEDAAAAGARRGLLRSALGLCCSGEVLADFDAAMDDAAGPLQDSDDLAEACGVTMEIYGSTRMLLAVLPLSELEAVCSGWSCDMWDVLAPLREVRPVNGGSGCEVELALDLRMLHLDITE